MINDGFSREPQIAEIIIKQTGQYKICHIYTLASCVPNITDYYVLFVPGQKFVIINVHVAPKNASVEINFLPNVHTWVKEKWRTGVCVILFHTN